MLEFLEVPWSIVRLPGLAETMKSGGATITRSMARWLTVPPIPFTVMMYWPTVVEAFVETVRTALAVGAEVESVMPEGSSIMLGEWVMLELRREASRLMSPVKPLTLARSNLKVVKSPACKTPDESDEASNE